ncbi:MAG: hypothetical protein R2729_21745 [Bryobacteraceae bacterium]
MKTLATFLAFAAALPSLWAERPPRADFSRMVVAGDSLSAGFQNFSLFSGASPGAPNGGQEHGFAKLVADQAGAALAQPLISYPGIPPALELGPGGQIIRSPLAPGMRIPPFVQPMNVSVPGFTIGDALLHAFPGNPFVNPIDALAATIFSGNPVPACGPIPTAAIPPPIRALTPSLDPATPFVVSQTLCAAALNPTLVLASIGNNDALGSLTLGLPPTPPVLFAIQYAAFLAAMKSTGADIVVGNVPDVTVAPFLIPAPAYAQLCGSIPPGATPADFIVPDINAPTFNICTNYQIRTAALIASARLAVAAYNRIIDFEARRAGATVVDVNKLLDKIDRVGYRLGRRRLTTEPLGGIFSLDFVHPTNTGYAILANEYIDTINKSLKTRIPLVSVEDVAAADPLVGLAP